MRKKHHDKNLIRFWHHQIRSQIVRKPENSEVTQTPGERCGRAGVRGNSQRELWSLAPEQTP